MGQRYALSGRLLIANGCKSTITVKTGFEGQAPEESGRSFACVFFLPLLLNEGAAGLFQGFSFAFLCGRLQRGGQEAQAKIGVEEATLAEEDVFGSLVFALLQKRAYIASAQELPSDVDDPQGHEGEGIVGEVGIDAPNPQAAAKEFEHGEVENEEETVESREEKKDQRVALEPAHLGHLPGVVRVMLQNRFAKSDVSPTHGEIEQERAYKETTLQRFVNLGVKPGLRLVLHKEEDGVEPYLQQGEKGVFQIGAMPLISRIEGEFDKEKIQGPQRPGKPNGEEEPLRMLQKDV